MQTTIKHPTKKIRLCLVCPKVYPLFNETVEAAFGGAEVDLYYLGTELAKDPDFEVIYITADYGQPKTEHRENVTLIKSVDFNGNPLIGAVNIWRAMKKANADFYMIKSISPGFFLVSLFCRLHRRKFVYRTAHATHCDGTYQKRKPLTGRAFIHSLRRSDILLTQNQSDTDNLRRLYGLDSVVIPNGHRLNQMTLSERRWILWIGRSADFKHPERFLELAKIFPQQPFVMICQRATGDTQYDTLKAAAKRIENLEFIERVSFHKIDRYFEQAKVFVNTSDSEGFPNTFIQACKSGTAILSYSVNPDGFLDKHQCGICCGGDKQQFVKQLHTMLSESQYQHFGKNGLDYVKARHDITTIIEQYKRLLKG